MSDERTLVRKSTVAAGLRAGEVPLVLRKMVLDVVLKYFGASQHFVARRALEGFRLNVFRHMVRYLPYLDNLSSTADHVASLIMHVLEMVHHHRELAEFLLHRTFVALQPVEFGN